MEGLHASIKLFPSPSDKNWIARVDFTVAQHIEDPLYRAIFERTTNRKAYSKAALTQEQKAEILSSSYEVVSGSIKLVEDENKIKELSGPISLNEQLIFENRHLHDFFYDHVHWTKEEDEKFRNGFFIDTLELNPPQRMAMKLMRSWRIASFAKKLGISRQVARDNAKNYTTASAFGVVVMQTNNADDYVLAGRIMERVWLKVTNMGLSLQPMTGVLFFNQRILANKAEAFSSDQIASIRQAYEKIKQGFDINSETIAMLFRLGKGGEPSARSLRFNLDDFIKK